MLSPGQILYIAEFCLCKVFWAFSSNKLLNKMLKYKGLCLTLGLFAGLFFCGEKCGVESVIRYHTLGV